MLRYLRGVQQHDRPVVWFVDALWPAQIAIHCTRHLCTAGNGINHKAAATGQIACDEQPVPTRHQRLGIVRHNTAVVYLNTHARQPGRVTLLSDRQQDQVGWDCEFGAIDSERPTASALVRFAQFHTETLEPDHATIVA